MQRHLIDQSAELEDATHPFGLKARRSMSTRSLCAMSLVTVCFQVSLRQKNSLIR